MTPNVWHVVALGAAFLVLIVLVEWAHEALDRRDQRDQRAANDRASRDAARRLEDLKNRGFFG